jgi:hypothetical protein
VAAGGPQLSPPTALGRSGAQMMSPHGHANIVSASTHDPYWKAVRKGIAVAFRANNMRCGAAPGGSLQGAGPVIIPVSAAPSRADCRLSYTLALQSTAAMQQQPAGTRTGACLGTPQHLLRSSGEHAGEHATRAQRRAASRRRARACLPCRAGFPRVVEAGRQLVDVLRAVSAGGATVDMSDALLRESIDVIGAPMGLLRPSHPGAHSPGSAAGGPMRRAVTQAALDGLWAPALCCTV